jgi:4-amino-4-deoxy-L-arabinose transferase-like glycosyltransferase
VLGYLRACLTPRRHADAPSFRLLTYTTLTQTIASGIRAARVLSWLPTLLILIAALLPRVAQLDDFYTTDEAYFWQGRVARFAAAVSMGDWAATNQTGHPGVTTMWLGSLGRMLVEQPPSYPPAGGAGAAYLAALRLPLAIVNGLAVVAGYLLLRRLLAPGAALLAALGWATSPFLIAHGRLLHLDALLTSFISLSLLCLLVATRPAPAAPRRGLLPLAGAGLFGGLALLTKAPALLLLPASGLILLAAELGRPPWSAKALVAAVRGATARLALWLVVAAATFALLWPAMWVSPGRAVGAVIAEVLSNGGQPHNAGNFFMGRPVADPGWPFYISVVAWRGELPMLLGLTLLLILGGYELSRRWRRLPPAAAPAEPAGDEGRVILAIGGFALLFALALTLLAKKFDRYLLPIWPSLEILGAIGLLAAARRLWASATVAASTRRAAAWAGGLLLAFALILPPLIYRPYYLAYYNPLLGGGTTAQQVLLTGWGEGMEQAGAWLSARPDLRRGPVLSWIPDTLKPFIPADVAVYDLDLDTLVEPANYAVVYSSVAERDARAVAEAFALQTPPLYTLRVRGITYLTIHQLPRPFERSVDVVFSGLHLRGFSSRFEGATLLLTPSWDIQVDRPGDVFSFIHVLDASGQRVAQLDTALDDGLFAQWQAGQQFGTELPIALSADLPPGDYHVVLGLYTPADGARVPLTHGTPLPESVAGPHAVRLLSFSIGEDRRGGLIE